MNPRIRLSRIFDKWLCYHLQWIGCFQSIRQYRVVFFLLYPRGGERMGYHLMRILEIYNSRAVPWFVPLFFSRAYRTSMEETATPIAIPIHMDRDRSFFEIAI